MYLRHSLLALAITSTVAGSATDRKVPLRPGLVRDGGSEAVVVPDFAISPRNLFDVSSPVKRQGCPSSCTSGFCCSDGTCVSSRTDKCCVGGFVCPSSQQCCHDGCIALSDECCRSGGYCESGTLCYLVRNQPKCCKNADCEGDLEDPEGNKSGSSSRTANTTSTPTSRTSIRIPLPTSFTDLGLPTTPPSLDIPDIPGGGGGGGAIGFGGEAYPYPVEIPRVEDLDLSDLSGSLSAADSLIHSALTSWRMILLSVLATVPLLLAIIL